MQRKILISVIVLIFFPILFLWFAKNISISANFENTENKSIKPDFDWGVLALNTNKSIYKIGEIAKFEFAVLDNKGEMVCDAGLELKIKNDELGMNEIYSIENKKIKKNNVCNSKKLTITPDFEADYKISDPGFYNLELTAKTEAGTRTIQDSFEVRESIPFDIERISATRIYPFNSYPVILKIKANQDYRGIVEEKVQSNFVTSALDQDKVKEYLNLDEDTPLQTGEVGEFKRVEVKNYKFLNWQVDWKKGQTYILSYQYGIPAISPELYKVGPAKVGNFAELRSWQIAVDADFTYGTASEFDADDVSRIAAVEIGTDKFVMCYGDGTGVTTVPGQCRVATVSGTTITWGTEAQFSTDIAVGTIDEQLGVCKFTTDKFAIAYTDDADDDGKVKAGSVSGTTITYSAAETEFSGNGDAEWVNCVGIGTDKIAVGYNDETNSDTAQTVICTASGTVVTCGTETEYSTGSTDYYSKFNDLTKLNTDKYLGAWRAEDNASSDDGYLVAVTVSGTTPSPGSVSSFTANDPQYIGTCSTADLGGTADQFVIVYEDTTNTLGGVKAGTVSSTTVTLGSETDFNPTSADIAWADCTFTDNTHFVVAYEDRGASENGKSAYCTVNWSTRAVTCNTDETFAAVQIGSSADGTDTEQRGITTISGYGNFAKIVVGYVEDGDGDDGMAIVADKSSITISGTIKQTNESSNYDCSAVTAVTVKAAVNGGTTRSADCTTSGGTFTITADQPGAADTPITVFIDTSETIKGTTVTLSANGTSNISNLDIHAERLIVTQESSTAITNSHLSTADNTDAGIRYAVSSGALTVDSDIELHVKTGKTFTPGNTVTTQGNGDLHVDDSATMTLGTATNTIARDILVDGGATLNINASTNVNGGDITTSGTSAVVTTTSGSPTVTMSGTGSIGGGTTPTLTFHNLSTTGTGTTTLSNTTTVNSTLAVGGTTSILVVAGTTTVTGDVTVAGGTTLRVNANLNVNGGDITTSGTSATVTTTSGTPTVTMSSTGSIGGGTTPSLTFYNLATTGTGTTTLSNSATINNNLAIGGTTAIFIASASTTVTGDVTVAGGTTLRINADMAINGGDITTSGTSATVTTTSGTPTVTISSTGAIGGGTTPTLTFHNLTTSGSGTTTISNTTTVNNDVSVGSGTTLQNNGSLTVTGDIAVTGKLTIAATLAVNGGDLTTSGTGVSGVSINYSNTPTATIASASEAHTLGGGTGTITFYNLTMNGSAQTTTLSTNNLVIDNALSVGTSHTFAMQTNSITIGSTSISDSGDITMANGAASSQSSSGTVTILGNSNAADWTGTGTGTFTAYNLTIGNGSATMTVDNETGDLSIDVNNTFTNTANATFQASSTGSFTVGHNWSNSTSGVFTANQGAVIFDGTSGNKTITSGGDSFYDFYIDNGGTAITWELQDNLDINGNLLIDTNNTLDAKSGSNFTINVAGNWTNNGTYLPRFNSTYFDGGIDTNQVVDGSTNFWTASFEVGDRIISFGAGDTFDFENELIAAGTSCASLILFRSTLKGSQYFITGAGGTGNYVDLQDGNFDSDSLIDSNSIDSGGNSTVVINSGSCISGSTDSTAIASGYSFQRKTFYDDQNARYWTFNHDGDEIEIRYSSNGTSWNNPATAASGHLAYDTNDFSVWWKQVGTTEYVWLAVSSGNDILVRRGELTTTNVTWDSDVITAMNGSGASSDYSYPYFSLDSSNYMWVGARYYNGTNYVYKAVRSDINDTGDATWDTNIGFGTTVTEAQLSDDQTNTNVFGNIVPLASQDMYATFVVNTAIEGCVWDHSDLAWENSDGSANCAVVAGGSGESEFFDSLEDDLVGYWKMNESSWNGTNGEVIDETANNLDGTRQGNATTTNMGFFKSGTFDGSGDYVSVGDNTPLDITGDFTLSAWYSRNGGTNGYIITKTNDAADGGYALLHGSSGEVYCRTNNGVSSVNSFTAGSLVNSDDVWHHLVAVRSGTSCRVWVDGVDRTSTANTHTTLTANNNALGIGSSPNGSAQVDGRIDDARIYNRALSGEEIAKLYQLHPERTNIDDASDFGALPGASRQMVRTTSGTIYSFLNDGGNCEMWKSTDGVTWTTVGSAKTCNSGAGVAIAIDSSNTIHVLWSRSTTGEGVMYDTFSSDAFGGLNNVVYTYATGDDFGSAAIAVDSSNIPHALFIINDGNGDSLLYDNRVGGTWGTDIAIDTNAAGGTITMSHPDIALNESDFVELVWLDGTTVTAMASDRNDPTLIDHFASHEIDTTGTEPSLAIDTLTGKTWVAYRDTSDNTIDLAGTTAAYAGWGTGGNWSIVTKTDVGSEPSVAVAGLSEAYVFYENDTDDISYDVYDGSSWNGEVVLQIGTFQDVKAKWAFEWNNFGANRIGYLFSDGTDVFWDYLYIRRSPTHIDNASDFENPKETGQVVRTSSGVLYSGLNDGGICEIWRSTDNGNTWSEQDSANHKSCVTGNPVVIEIDSSNNIHMVYHITGEDINYVVFNTTTNTFGTAETVVNGNSVDGLDLALDSSDKPHIITMHTNVSDDVSIYYLNKTGSSWSGVTTIVTALGGTNTYASFSIVVNDEDIPEVAYSDDTNLDLIAVLGNQNNATSFSTSHTVDSSLSSTGMTIGVDSSGNTWISYMDDDGYITLAKHPDGSAWTSGWTTDITNSKVISSNTHSMSIDGSDVYLFYEDDQDDIVYDKYNGSAWSGETLLEEHGSLSSPIVRWSYFNNYDSTGVAPVQTNTYYFDVSDAGPTDSGAAWTNDSNAFDSDVTTFASTTTANAYLVGEGTNAPASGGTITSVKARLNAIWDGTNACGMQAEIYTNGLGQLLGNPTVNSASQTWSSYVTLTTPTGGWAWDKIQALEARNVIFDDGVGCTTTTGRVYKIEVLVQSTNTASQTEFDYVYHDGTDVFYNRLLPGGSTPGTQDSIATTTVSDSTRQFSISAVSDSASPNDVHLLYLDNSATAKVLYKRWDNNGASSAWQAAATVEDTGSTTYKYVSLTLDTSTKDLWAAFIDQTSDDDVYYVRCDVETTTDECDASAEWDTNPTSESTATGSVYNSLTTNYNSTGNVFGIWTNTSATPFAVSWSSINAAATNAAPSAPTTLYANESETTAQSGVANPVGVGDSTPAFSAVYADSDTGDIANKYEVIVYSDAGCTTQVWDSGSNGTSMTNCTQGNRCADIEFAGTALPFDGVKYYWKIKYWDDEPAAGSFSDCTANFTMLSPAEQLKHGNYFFNQSTERKYTW